jgi:hypothetical protein
MLRALARMTTQSRAAEAGRDSRDFLLMGLLCAVFPDDPDGAGPPSFRTVSEISWDLSLLICSPPTPNLQYSADLSNVSALTSVTLALARFLRRNIQ